MLRVIKARLKKLARSFGYTIEHASRPGGRATMEDAFRALVRRRHAINTVVDIGASNGSWSASLMRHLPSCEYLLVEAQPVHRDALQEFCARTRNAQFALAAAGEKSGEIYFNAADPVGGQASYVPHSAADIRVPVVTIDAEVQARRLRGPFLLKFDTHGFEVPILKGATATLESTDVVIMECYNFRIAPEALTFDEMCQFMGQRGFRCIDLVDPMHRPCDDSFWQMDLVFVRKNRPEFAYLHYK
ncbi:MAG: FkbM family methyltransferase [Steroidobacteraceae bacterium]